MKPKKYLEELDKLVLDSCSTNKEYRLGMKAGAQHMWELMRAKQKQYRDEHRDELREYNTKYQRERRARLKAMEEDIDKISKMD